MKATKRSQYGPPIVVKIGTRRGKAKLHDERLLATSYEQYPVTARTAFIEFHRWMIKRLDFPFGDERAIAYHRRELMKWIGVRTRSRKP